MTPRQLNIVLSIAEILIEASFLAASFDSKIAVLLFGILLGNSSHILYRNIKDAYTIKIIKKNEQ